MFSKGIKIGPGAVVAAAFIGPGTVTTATIAGSNYGYTLLWAVLFSVLTTLALQEMSARLGTMSGLGLGEALRKKISNSIFRLLVSFMVIAAIFIGNAAYEAGNITGAVLGISYPQDSWPFNPWVLLIGITAFLLLWHGKYSIIERSLITLVGIMGLVFLLSALMVKPSLPAILSGLFQPKLPKGSLVMVVSLIGTTVVPYNLFLHASSAKTRWAAGDLRSARLDTLISITVGGLITMAILVTSAVAFENSQTQINSITDLSVQLTPLLGKWSTGFMSIGFLAAGLSSAITAPLAASFVTAEIVGWDTNLRGAKFKLIWGLVLATGIIFSSLGFSPTLLIVFAQFANGLLLPVIAILLLWMVNDRNIMGSKVNSTITNIIGVAVIAVAILLGAKGLGAL